MAWAIDSMLVDEVPGEGIRIRVNAIFNSLDLGSAPAMMEMSMEGGRKLDIIQLMSMVLEAGPPIEEHFMAVLHANDDLSELTFVAFDRWDDLFGQADDLPPGKYTMMGKTDA